MSSNKPASTSIKLIGPKVQDQRTFLPTMPEFNKSDIKFYKKYNIEPPIDIRSNSRRYKDALNSRIKKTSPRDASTKRRYK